MVSINLFKRKPKATTGEDAASNASAKKNSSETKKTNAKGKLQKEEVETTTLRVKIPPNVKAGQQFAVYNGTRKIKLTCPKNAQAGQSLMIKVPKENTEKHVNGENVIPIPDSSPPAYDVIIPPNTRGGTKFAVLINGTTMMVTAPANAVAGMKLRIVPQQLKLIDKKRQKGQTFEVRVPEHIQPGESFSLMANGMRIILQCPQNAEGGQMVRFNLPFRSKNMVVKKLEYDVDGWARTLQVAQMKFQWARVSKKRKSMKNSIAKRMNENAYVRHISKHGMELIPAQCELVDSSLVTDQGEELANFEDLIEMQRKSLSEKTDAFHKLCKRLGREDSKDRSFVCIKVRRENLLGDSLRAVMSLNQENLRRRWVVQFKGEEGIDAGGLKREWFELISEELFDLNTGLWMTSGDNQMNLQIHPASNILNEGCLLYFRFLGRVLGKALFDGELVKGHMVQTFYKHLLGWPVTFQDLENLDPEYYKSIKALMEMDDVEYACLDFTTNEDMMGTHKTIDLIPDGANVDVTTENIVRYLEAILNYRLVGRFREQLRELSLGFTDVVPPSLLTIFDYQELELLLCGLPTIDMNDWMNNTSYTGLFKSEKDVVISWFWETVIEMEEEKKARLLQFATGSSGVPPNGFAFLKGNDGRISTFKIHGVPVETCMYPRAHTCFNRIDLPKFESKEQLQERLEVAITMVSTGFDLE